MLVLLIIETGLWVWESLLGSITRELRRRVLPLLRLYAFLYTGNLLRVRELVVCATWAV
jgi:hypothetical protein